MTNITVTAEYVSDENNNRCYIRYFGSIDKAKNALESLKNCVNCVNCNDCHYCNDCKDCVYCTNCNDCTNCNRCHYCVNCTNCNSCTNCNDCNDCTNCSWCESLFKISSVSKPYAIGGIRHDGYMFVAFKDNDTIHIRAGCHVFTLDQAREHWKNSEESLLIVNNCVALLKYIKHE